MTRADPGFDVEAVVGRLLALMPATRPLPLHEPTFAGREWEYVKDCLDTGWVSTVGSYVTAFERMLAERLGVPHVVAVVNGTAALHAAFLVVGVKPGDEVLVPALTFVATANAVAHCGAVPHFVDSERTTLGLDPLKLDAWLGETAEVRDGVCFNRRTGRIIRAVAPMHVFGHTVDMEPLAEVAGRWCLTVVEDAAESLGSLYKGRPAGSLGRISTLSFNGNKIVTTGGGGAIAMSDPQIAAAVRHLTTTAKQPHPWAFLHDQVAYNYRLPNLNAALGCAQLEQLDGLLRRKRDLAGRYHRAFAGLPGVETVAEPPDCRSNYWLNAILVPDLAGRDAVLAATHAEKLLTRPVWALLHRLPMFAGCPCGDLSVAEELECRLVNLPSSPSLMPAPAEVGDGPASSPAAPDVR